jgi:predicted amidophosphoribosyltransferase
VKNLKRKCLKCGKVIPKIQDYWMCRRCREDASDVVEHDVLPSEGLQKQDGRKKPYIAAS